jgi:acetolactate decarboxylase
VIDERLIGALHLSSGTHEDDPGEAHRVFQASTISALLDGAYEGDVTFAELASRGDFGIGTLNGCDGEMVAIEGSFLRADTKGRIEAVDPEAKTPFAVLTNFEARHRLVLEEGEATSYDAICSEVDARIGHPEIVHAVRVDGRFKHLHLRSVPRQEPPYRPLADVLEDQTVFDFEDLEGTLVGFRFPDLTLGVGVAGYHRGGRFETGGLQGDAGVRQGVSGLRLVSAHIDQVAGNPPEEGARRHHVHAFPGGGAPIVREHDAFRGREALLGHQHPGFVLEGHNGVHQLSVPLPGLHPLGEGFPSGST